MPRLKRHESSARFPGVAKSKILGKNTKVVGFSGTKCDPKRREKVAGTMLCTRKKGGVKKREEELCRK